MIKLANNKDISLLKEISNSTIEKSFKGLYEDGLIDLYIKKYSYNYFKNFIGEIVFFIYFLDGKGIGMIGIKGNILVDFYVLKEYQNIGIGTKLLDYIIDYAKEIGIKQLQLQSSKIGRTFYKIKGFEYVRDINKIKGNFKYTNSVYKLNLD